MLCTHTHLQHDVGPNRGREHGGQGDLARGGAIQALHGDEGASGGHLVWVETSGSSGW